MQRLPKIEPAIGALSLIGTRRSSGRTVPPHCVPLRSEVSPAMRRIRFPRQRLLVILSARMKEEAKT
jgi:hypothetical protein